MKEDEWNEIFKWCFTSAMNNIKMIEIYVKWMWIRLTQLNYKFILITENTTTKIRRWKKMWKMRNKTTASLCVHLCELLTVSLKIMKEQFQIRQTRTFQCIYTVSTWPGTQRCACISYSRFFLLFLLSFYSFFYFSAGLRHRYFFMIIIILIITALK